MIDFSDCVNFVRQPIESNPIWATLHRIPPNEDPELNQADYCYHDDGIELICNINPDIILDTIYLYLQGETNNRPDREDYKPFTGILPYPLQRDMNKIHTVGALGKPEKIGGDFEHDILGYQRPWIKYYPKPKVQLMIEFDDDSMIWRIGVGKAFY